MLLYHSFRNVAANGRGNHAFANCATSNYLNIGFFMTFRLENCMEAKATIETGLLLMSPLECPTDTGIENAVNL